MFEEVGGCADIFAYHAFLTMEDTVIRAGYGRADVDLPLPYLGISDGGVCGVFDNDPPQAVALVFYYRVPSVGGEYFGDYIRHLFFYFKFYFHFCVFCVFSTVNIAVYK
jgi:hypothetical protein